MWLSDSCADIGGELNLPLEGPPCSSRADQLAQAGIRECTWVAEQIVVISRRRTTWAIHAEDAASTAEYTEPIQRERARSWNRLGRLFQARARRLRFGQASPDTAL